MSENQKQGIYMEDPAVTLELLNSEEHKKILSRQMKKSKKSISVFVDQFISLSQVKVKNEEIDEIHLTPEMRHASLDSRELVK